MAAYIACRALKHGPAAKPLRQGPQGGLRAAGARKGGIGGVYHLEESFFPPADISCDVVASRCCAHERIKRPRLSGRTSWDGPSTAARVELAAPGGAR